jgi:integrase
VEEKGRETRLRRALSDVELAKLIEGAPHYRGIAYFTAARTGLRHGELAQLKWGDVDFDSDTPHVLARAGTTKNRKDTAFLSQGSLKPPCWPTNQMMRRRPIRFSPRGFLELVL